MDAMPTIYRTSDGTEISVEPGKKSDHDFRVRFRQPNRVLRTPARLHLIAELYVKYARNPGLTLKLRDHLLELYERVPVCEEYPPKVSLFSPDAAEKFKDLDAVGEFTVEFLLVVSELIFTREKTNYTNGSTLQTLYEKFGKSDRFSVIQTAIFGRRRRYTPVTQRT
jgi:hypothetical protein